MDIYIAIDKRDKKKFITKAMEVKQELEKQNRDIKLVWNETDIKNNKQSLCLVFTNSLEYIEEFKTNKKIETICITNRLESQYILAVLKCVKDIYFLNMGLEEMVIRIQGFVNSYENRRKCYRGIINEI